MNRHSILFVVIIALTTSCKKSTVEPAPKNSATSQYTFAPVIDFLRREGASAENLNEKRIDALREDVIKIRSNENLVDIKTIAWATKFPIALPPPPPSMIWEELIVSLEFDRTVELVHLWRRIDLGHQPVVNTWKIGRTYGIQGFSKDKETVESHWTEKELMDFVSSTSFGNNVANSNNIPATIVYIGSFDELRTLLRDGIDTKERARRSILQLRGILVKPE